MAVTPKRRTRKISLAFMGEEWKEAYISFRYLTWEDSKRQREREQQMQNDDYLAVDAMYETVMEAFIEGKALDDNNQMVDVTKEYISGMDVAAISELYPRVLGVPDPNDSRLLPATPAAQSQPQST